MTSPETHKKHVELNRAAVGQFHRSEVAILGTTCDAVKEFVHQIKSLFPENNIAYADESHAADDPKEGNKNTSWLKHHNQIELNSSYPDNRFQRNFSLSQADCVIVNGNHFESTTQVVVCNPEKENSLRKRKDQLTQVTAILLTGNQTIVPDYVTELAGSTTSFHISDTQKLSQFFLENYLKPAPLKGLIMAGGKSLRMGQDKPWINFNGLPQVLFLSEIMKRSGIDTWISCREEQRDNFESQGLKTISDRILNFGPLGGIASAFMTDPNTAWLVLASDIPLFDEAMLLELMTARQTGGSATSFVSPHDGMPEPLAAIWEPRIYQQIMQFISLGYTCPRKVLMNTSAHLIQATIPEKLMNVNTPGDLVNMHNLKSKA
ncbi:MAG: NTP transferase domain-containing protein [Flavobacteriales bacterium]